MSMSDKDALFLLPYASAAARASRCGLLYTIAFPTPRAIEIFLHLPFFFFSLFFPFPARCNRVHRRSCLLRRRASLLFLFSNIIAVRDNDDFSHAREPVLLLFSFFFLGVNTDAPSASCASALHGPSLTNHCGRFSLAAAEATSSFSFFFPLLGIDCDRSSSRTISLSSSEVRMSNRPFVDDTWVLPPSFFSFSFFRSNGSGRPQPIHRSFLPPARRMRTGLAEPA